MAIIRKVLTACGYANVAGALLLAMVVYRLSSSLHLAWTVFAAAVVITINMKMYIEAAAQAVYDATDKALTRRIRYVQCREEIENGNSESK